MYIGSRTQSKTNWPRILFIAPPVTHIVHQSLTKQKNNQRRIESRCSLLCISWNRGNMSPLTPELCNSMIALAVMSSDWPISLDLNGKHNCLKNRQAAGGVKQVLFVVAGAPTCYNRLTGIYTKTSKNAPIQKITEKNTKYTRRQHKMRKRKGIPIFLAWFKFLQNK